MTEASKPSRVWATLLTQPTYLAGALVLNRTLQAASKYPLVIMATDTLPASSRDVLERSGLRIIDVNHISPAEGQHSGFDTSFNRFNDAWTKLAVFGLTEFEKVILIDSDMLVLQSMDELFDMELPGEDWIAAAPACVCNPFKIAHYPADWIPENCAISRQSTDMKLNDAPIPPKDGSRTAHQLNSGLVVLKPMESTLKSLIHFLHTSPTIAASRFADQDVIAEAFHGRWKPLPWWTNALKPLRAAHPTVWKDTSVRNIHYILAKPWDNRPSNISSTADMPISSSPAPSELPPDLLKMVADTPPQRSMTDYDEVHAWWWVAYFTLIGELKASGDQVVWKEMDKFIGQ